MVCHMMNTACSTASTQYLTTANGIAIGCGRGRFDGRASGGRTIMMMNGQDQLKSNHHYFTLLKKYIDTVLMRVTSPGARTDIT